MRHLTFSTTTTTLLGALALLAACGSQPSGTIAAPDGETAEYRIDEASGETSMTIRTPEGEARMRSGQSVPLALQGGFTLFPGSTVISNTVVDQPEGTGNMVIFETAAKPAEIIAHFKRHAEQAGYTIEIEAAMGAALMLSGQRAAPATSFMVTTGPPEDGTVSGQLVISTNTEG
jgi:type IV pilus biogenesis protein CpaD/CtpE